MPSLTRGPLPSSVYWRRRLIIITIALVLVVGIAKLLGGGGGSGGDAVKLSDQGNSVSPTPTAPSDTTSAPAAPYAAPTASYGPPAPPALASPSVSSSSGSASRSASGGPSGTPTSALPAPVGDCSASDIAVIPSVGTAHAYDSVTISLQLHTLKATACTWHVSPDALQARITRKGVVVWSTVECRGAIPTQDVVVRRDSVTVLPIVWQGHRVVADACSAHAPWSTPGTFTVVASSLGGEPAQTTFPLLAPGASPSADGSASSSPSGSPSATTSVTGTTSPTPTGGTRTHGPAVR